MRALGRDMAARITNSPALTKLLGSLPAVDSPPLVFRRCYFWLVRPMDKGAGWA
jgi:hypothetical protein